MNIDIIQGHWKQIEGKIKQKWGKFTDDDIATMKGTFEELSGKIQTAYGYEKDQADKEINAFLKDEKLGD